MSEGRIETAMARIEAAMQRINAARAALPEKLSQSAPANPEDKPADPAASAKVMALVNTHEKLREEVADTMREIDNLIEELEG